MGYTWNDRGEMTARSRTSPTTPIPSAQRIFQHGFEDGTQTITETLGFDQARRLVSFQGQVTHAYDAHNHRIRTVTPNWGTRCQVYSRSGELLYIEDSALQERTEFYHLGNTLVAERTRPTTSETATVNYLHSDHRGTPTVKTSTAGTRTYRSRLMPYGAPYDGVYRDGPGFTKHATDEISSMSYMQQRYFDPNLPGFISPDPMGRTAESFNAYAYARNNPYSFIDPDGRCEAPTGTHVCTSVRSFSAKDITIVQSYDTRSQTPVALPQGSNEGSKLQPVQQQAAKALNRAGRELQSRGLKEHIAILNKAEIFLSVQTVGEGKAFVSQPPVIHIVVNFEPFGRLWDGHKVGAMLHEIHHFSAKNRGLYENQRDNGKPMGTGTGYENDAFQFQRDLGFPASGYFDFDGL